MKTLRLFDFDDYCAYLKAVIAAQPRRGHGYRSQLAKVIGCHIAYVSQVLAGKADLSLEQAEALNGHLGHSESQADYFLLLVQSARAGSVPLRARLRNKIDLLRGKQNQLRHRIEQTDKVADEHMPKYYSSWIYPACHIATTLEKPPTSRDLARLLRVSEDTVVKTMRFLSQAGLVNETGSGWTPGISRVFLKSDSPLIVSNHRNWRLRALSEIEADPSRGLHFSGLFSLSETDAIQIRTELLEKIEEVRSVVKASRAEELQVLGLDFFKLG